MSDYTIKVKDGDRLILGSESSPRALFPVGGGQQNIASYEKVSTTGATVIDPAVGTTLLTTGGVHALSLADGTYAGQQKRIYMVATGGDGTLTPANFADGSTITFDAIGDWCDLIFDGTNWNLAAYTGIAVA